MAKSYTVHNFSNFYNLLSTEINYRQSTLDFQFSLPENLRDNYLIKFVTDKINTLKAVQSEIKSFPQNILYKVSDSDPTDYIIRKD